jgi:hypothetical protein
MILRGNISIPQDLSQNINNICKKPHVYIFATQEWKIVIM